MSTHMLQRLDVAATPGFGADGEAFLEVRVFGDEHQGRAIVRIDADESSGVHSNSVKATERAMSSISGPIRDVLRISPAEPVHFDHVLVDLDGTKDWSRLTRSAMFGTSLAFWRMCAGEREIPLWALLSKEASTLPGLPAYRTTLLRRDEAKEKTLLFHEYDVLVSGKSGAESSAVIASIHARLGRILRRHALRSDHVNDDAYSPVILTPEGPFESLRHAIGDEMGIRFALNAGIGRLYRRGAYHYGGERYTRDDLILLYETLKQRFDIASIDEPLYPGDIDGLQEMTGKMANNISISAPSLTLTNADRVRRVAFLRAINTLTVDVSDVGTISEVIDAVSVARSASWRVHARASSLGAVDACVADIAVGLGCDEIKIPLGKDRAHLLEKTRLTRIEKEMAG